MAIESVHARKVPKETALRKQVNWVFRGPRNPEKLALAVQRVTGVGLLLYLVFHVVVTSTVTGGYATWTGVMTTLASPFSHLGEILVVTAVGFHAVNGLRVMFLELTGLTGRPARPDYPYKVASLGRGQRSLLVVSVVMAVLGATGAILAVWGV